MKKDKSTQVGYETNFQIEFGLNVKTLKEEVRMCARKLFEILWMMKNVWPKKCLVQKWTVDNCLFMQNLFISTVKGDVVDYKIFDYITYLYFKIKKPKSVGCF